MATGKMESIERLRAQTAFERGRYFFNSGRYLEALSAHEDAISFDPSFLRAIAAKSITLSALGRAREGLVVAEALVADNPGSAYAHMARAQALLDLGQSDLAQRAFERALELEPDEYTLNYNFACFWARRRDAEKCKIYLKRTLELAPNQNAHAAIDADFEPFRECEWFQELIAFKKPEGSR